MKNVSHGTEDRYVALCKRLGFPELRVPSCNKSSVGISIRYAQPHGTVVLGNCGRKHLKSFRILDISNSSGREEISKYFFFYYCSLNNLFELTQKLLGEGIKYFVASMT